MPPAQMKADLLHYLAAAREALVWKLDGLSEYDARRPLVATGTNLLGLVKHSAGVEIGYFGEVFGRPFPEQLPWLDIHGAPNTDMWATPDEDRDEIVGLYRRVWTHADETIQTLELDAVGRVPWWPADRQQVTLQRVVVHVVAETQRHAGHADVVRELIDGSAGIRAGHSNLPDEGAEWWRAYRDRVESAALSAAAQRGEPAS